MSFDETIMALYTKGPTTHDIADKLAEMYGAEVSHTLISQVTGSILEEVETWQNRPLDNVYPLPYLTIPMKSERLFIRQMPLNRLTT